MDDLTEYLDLAANVAQAAAGHLLAERARGRKVCLSPDKDVKIEADYMLDRLICGQLRQRSGLPILSEESEPPDFDGGDQYRWVVDPLDGSLNFSRDIPFSCISIALWRGMTPVLGVIHDVTRDERFSGLVGRGTWLNGTRVCVSDVRETRDAVLCTGFPAKADYATGALLAFVAGVQAYKKVRLLGSAALSLAYVACGRADAYREHHISLWDVGAGLALVTAAGGTTRFRLTGEAWAMTVEAGNGHLGVPEVVEDEGEALP
jgi:fructose-1,6-bisphosphatase/inositol monophosphatase family enzyme